MEKGIKVNLDDRIKEVMSTVFQVPATSIDDSSTMDSIAKWDSVNHLKLVLALEEAFSISFTESQTVELLSYPLIKMILQEHGVTRIK